MSQSAHGAESDDSMLSEGEEYLGKLIEAWVNGG